MAYADLVSLAQTIDQILNYHQRRPIPLHYRQQIISIHEYAIFLQAFLDDFSEKAISLEGRIGDAAAEAEDIIECFISGQILSLRSKYKHHLGGRDFDDLKRVAEEFDSIAEEAMLVLNSLRIKDAPPLSDVPTVTLSPNLVSTGKNNMVGFNDDLIAIQTRLCGESSNLQVIPIAGMGGIGKTTLARNAYEDQLSMQYFDIRAWVTVSQHYSAQDVFSGLVFSMKEYVKQGSDQGNESTIESMKQTLYQTLKGRRYLIVLDDMWTTKTWDDVRKVFPDDVNGSRVMLTTRLSDVASYADPSSPLHQMRFMDADQSWDLLRQKVFAQEDCPLELEWVGKEIAKNCRGLPLAVVVIAGLLSTVGKTRASWEEIARNVNSAVATDGQIEKILHLSYAHLPHHLRPCFLYMGGFPEDYEIHVPKLMKLWVGEGFLRPNGSKIFEEGAEEYLEDLVGRNLVFVTKRKSNGKIKSCNIHDLVRDLCIRIANEEKFHRHVMDRYVSDVLLERIKNQRRVCISHSYLDWEANIYGSRIRTVICFQRNASSLGFIGNIRLLRVLDVVDSNFSPFVLFVSLPPQVFGLFHLRYLAFSYPTMIPPTISNLQNLQTLIIRPMETCLVYLPKEIWGMPQLRHLECHSFGPLPNPERSTTCALENLQTLSTVTDFICSERILKMIPNLQKMGIIYSGDICDQDFKLDNLVSLHQLEKLKLQAARGFTSPPKLNLAFPSMLKKLTLSGSGLISWKDMTVVGSLPNLQVLKLRCSVCGRGDWVTNEGEFTQLKFLLIDNSDPERWITERNHFPVLRCLLLHHCKYLSEIPDGVGDITTLELIEVKYGNKSLVDSAKQIQEDQESYGNDALQVHCMPY